jgi:hypothetical protein
MVISDPLAGVVLRDVGADTPARMVFAATLGDGFTTPGTRAILEILAETAATYNARAALGSSAA